MNSVISQCIGIQLLVKMIYKFVKRNNNNKKRENKLKKGGGEVKLQFTLKIN